MGHVPASVLLPCWRMCKRKEDMRSATGGAVTARLEALIPVPMSTAGGAVASGGAVPAGAAVSGTEPTAMSAPSSEAAVSQKRQNRRWRPCHTLRRRWRLLGPQTLQSPPCLCPPLGPGPLLVTPLRPTSRRLLVLSSRKRRQLAGSVVEAARYARRPAPRGAPRSGLSTCPDPHTGGVCGHISRA